MFLLAFVSFAFNFLNFRRFIWDSFYKNLSFFKWREILFRENKNYAVINRQKFIIFFSKLFSASIELLKLNQFKNLVQNK